MANVKEFLLRPETGEVNVEYDDNSTNKFNLANTVTAIPSDQGVVFRSMTQLTQAQYDALAVKDAAVMYVIVG